MPLQQRPPRPSLSPPPPPLCSLSALQPGLISAEIRPGWPSGFRPAISLQPGGGPASDNAVGERRRGERGGGALEPPPKMSTLFVSLEGAGVAAGGGGISTPSAAAGDGRSW